MKHYLVVFDRSSGSIVRSSEHVQASDALDARFEAEAAHRRNRDIEVVVLGAASWGALRRTHGRYFQSVRELANGAFDRIQEASAAAV